MASELQSQKNPTKSWWVKHGDEFHPMGFIESLKNYQQKIRSRLCFTNLTPPQKSPALWSGLMKTHWFPLKAGVVQPLFLFRGTG